MSLPAGVTTGLVTGTFSTIVGGASVPLDGVIVNFTPSAPVVLDAGASQTLALGVVQGVVKAGVLKDLTGNVGVTLVATDSAGINPTGFTWQVQFSGAPVGLSAFSFALPTGSTQDLALISPTPPVPPAPTMVATDAAMAALVSGGTLTKAALNGSFAQFTGRSRDRLQAANAGGSVTWRAALANRDNAPAKILCIGDSVTEGQGATSATSPWTYRLKQAMSALFPRSRTGDRSNYRSTKTSQTTFTTEWTVSGVPAVVFDYGISHSAYQISGAQTLTLTAFGTSVGISYLKGSGIGSWSYAVDGAAPVTVNATAVSTSDGNIQSIVFDSRGTHTVVIAAVSGNSVINGAFMYDGDEGAGIQVVNAGHSGATTVSWITTWSTARLTENIAAYAPHLVTIALGHNDYNAANSITPTQFGANLQTLVSLVNAAVPVPPSIVLVGYAKRGDYTNPTYTWQNYLDQLQAVALANPNVTYVDLSLRMPDGTDTVYGLYYDQLHPSNKGHAYIADVLTGYLTQDVASGPGLQPLTRGQASPSPSRTGLYYGGMLQSLSTGAFGLTNMKIQPLSLGRAGTIDRIGCEVTAAAAGALVRLFIYDDSEGAPGNLLVDAGTIDGSTTGYKENTISLPVTPGVFWVGAVSVGTADCTLRSLIGSNQMVGITGTPAAGQSSAGYQGTFSSSLPARWPALATASSVPRVWVRLS